MWCGLTFLERNLADSWCAALFFHSLHTTMSSERSEGLTHLLVLDFEATCDDNRSFGPTEIIEFPVVFVELASRSIVHEFHTYVRPVAIPELTPFCTQLTGIEQSTVDGGVLLEEALSGLRQAMTEVLGEDPDPSSFVFVTCGDWDLKTMLPKEVKRKNLASSVPPGMDQWCNIKHVFSSVTGVRARGMKGMLDHLGLELVGRHHSGIDDSRNIAALALNLLEAAPPSTSPSELFKARKATPKPTRGRGRNRQVKQS